MKVTGPSWWAEARELRQKGMRVADIAAKFQCSEQRVYQLTGKDWAGYDPKTHGPGGNVKEKQKAGNQVLAEMQQQNISPEEADKLAKLDQRFEPVIPSDFTQHHRYIFRIRCGATDCKQASLYKVNGVTSFDKIAKHFLAEGWAVGAGPRAHRCPTHMGRNKSQIPAPETAGHQMDLEEAIAAKNGHVPVEEMDLHEEGAKKFMAAINAGQRSYAGAATVENPVVVDAAPEPKPTLSVPVNLAVESADMRRDDKRLIFAKIDEHYGDETTGYKDGWSDVMVARDLGVPLAWVQKVRLEDFGPEFSTREIQKNELRDLGKVIFELNDVYSAQAKDLEEIIKAYDDKVENHDKAREELKAAYAQFTALFNGLNKL